MLQEVNRAKSSKLQIPCGTSDRRHGEVHCRLGLIYAHTGQGAVPLATQVCSWP
mgnify:CR=1 FL=1